MPDLLRTWLDHSQSDRDFVAGVTDSAARAARLRQLDRLRKLLLMFLLFFALALVVENALTANVPSSNSLLVVGFVFVAVWHTRVDFKIKTMKLYAAALDLSASPNSGT